MTLSYSERCYNEATRDAIFLLQYRKYNLITLPSSTSEYRYDHDGEGVTRYSQDPETGKYDVFDEDNPYMTWEQLKGMEGDDGVPCVLEEWITDRVFASREEAISWAKRDGWRVYCVCAEGDLAKLIQQYPSPEWSLAWPTEPGDYWMLLVGWQTPRLTSVSMEVETGRLHYHNQYGEVKHQLAAWKPANIPSAEKGIALIQKHITDSLKG